MIWWYSQIKKSYNIKGLRGDPKRGLGTYMRIKSDTDRFYYGIVIKLDWKISVINNAFAYTQDARLVQNVFSDDFFYHWHAYDRWGKKIMALDQGDH
jgi:hypothetical protein